MSLLSSLNSPVINHATLSSLLSDYVRPNDKISELIKKNQISPLKRGLYLVINNSQPSPELMANHLYGPSYVSRHWALSFYGLLSERVSDVTSMCLERSRRVTTAEYTFDYKKIPINYYAVGIESIQQHGIAFMMATPEKSLSDLLVTTRNLRIQSAGAMLSYLENDLRLDEEDLLHFKLSRIENYATQGYKSEMLGHLVSAIKILQNAPVRHSSKTLNEVGDND